MIDAQLEVRTHRFDADLSELVDELGFRVDAIFPADDPSTAVVSAYGIRLRLIETEAAESDPATVRLITDDPSVVDHLLPGGTRLRVYPRTTTYTLPDNDPSVVLSRAGAGGEPGRAGMLYRDLIPDRWGGRFISSLIHIPDGGPVPDYVHFHKVRFQMIFVKDGWVRLVYEDQGEPFVMERGDCVLQPPEIRHRVLESSPGLEVVEIGCPAEHETIADWSMPLPNSAGGADRRWDGQRFVRHLAAEAEYLPWRIAGWEYRDTGIGDATEGLVGARVARPSGAVDTAAAAIRHDTEFCQLVVLRGAVSVDIEDRPPVELVEGDAVALPGNVAYALSAPSDDCELFDVTVPASVG